jgi:hypothetical protein
MVIGDVGQELAGTEVGHQPFQVAPRIRAPGMVLADLLPVAAGRDVQGQGTVFVSFGCFGCFTGLLSGLPLEIVFDALSFALAFCA